MNRSLLLSLVLAIFAVVWVASGSITTDTDTVDSAAKTSSDLPLFKVRVAPLSAQPMTDTVTLQGGIKALRDIEIRAETHGTISTLAVQKGARMQAGDLILELAVSDRQARLQKAKAELALREVDLESSRKLRAKNLISENQHQQNVANVAAARASVKEIEVELEHTRLRAAFSGILNNLYVEQGDYVASGDPIATLVDDSQIIITAEVPQQHISRLKLGQSVHARLLDGRRITGTISYISNAANPGTRTFLIEAKADNSGQVRRFGQSASVDIQLGEQLAHKVSPSLLNLSTEGSLQVKGVNAENIVITREVEILRSERDGVWLAGLPEEFSVITVGQGFVANGDRVDPVIETGADASQNASEARL